MITHSSGDAPPTSIEPAGEQEYLSFIEVKRLFYWCMRGSFSRLII